MGKSKTTTTTVQSRDPYAPARAGLNTAAGQINSYLSNPLTSQVYEGPRVAGITGQTSQGIDRLGAAGGANASSDYLKRVLNGDYLNEGNPYQASVDEGIKASVLPSLNAQFSNAGMSGSTLHQGVIGKELTDAIGRQRYGQYNQERGYQNQAAQLLPGVDQQVAQQMIQAGQLREGYTQREYDAARQLFLERQQAPLQGVAAAMPYLNQIAGAGGTSSGTNTQSTATPIGQQILGGALVGTSLLGPSGFGGGSSYGYGGAGMGMIGNGLRGSFGPYAPGLPWGSY